MSDLLSTPPQRPDIRRGPGYRLSTEADDAAPTSDVTRSRNLENQKSTREALADTVVRVKLGYKVREDLIKRLKRVALNDDRFVYQVMEEAFEVYLAARAATREQE